MTLKSIILVSMVLALLAGTFGLASNAEASSLCGGTYVVQRGDWMAKIARRCGVTLTSLLAANPWAGNRIYPGQILYVPGGGYTDPYYGYCGPSWDGYGSYWVVCRGDTLGGIALYYGTSWRYLQSINGIPNPNRIYPGQVIRVY